MTQAITTGWQDFFADKPIGSTIPVYHNICGSRTTYRTCDCATCRKLFREVEAGLEKSPLPAPPEAGESQ